jgi:hypothetical protein
VCRRIRAGREPLRPVTALCFLATISGPRRNGRSRNVGAYVGLTTRRYASASRMGGFNLEVMTPASVGRSREANYDRVSMRAFSPLISRSSPASKRSSRSLWNIRVDAWVLHCRKVSELRLPVREIERAPA